MMENFNRIYNLYKNDIYRLAFSYTKNILDSEDVVQNTFIKFFKQKKSINNDIEIKKWLIKVAVNDCKNLILSSWHRKTRLLTDIEEKNIQNIIKEDNLLDALFILDRKDRIIVHLYYYEDYSVKEIGKLLKLKESAVKTRLFRARGKLKEILKEEWNYEE